MWERDEIEHERSLNDDFVTLELDESLSVGQSPFENFLIEGDNFDALRYLHIAYKGRVKCIYIDPPYNTGNKDFVFNDTFVEKDDGYRHSKWLEYMYRRLLLAKDLLADDGVIFVSIDDIENAHLALLMDQVFPGMRVGTFVWRRRSGANDSKDWFLSVDHEYVLCYANKDFTFAGTTKNLSSYSNPDGDDRGDWDSGDLNKAHNFKQRPEAFYPLHNPATDVYYACDPGSVWRFATKARLFNGKKIRTKPIEQMIEEKRVLWPNDDQFVIYQSVAEIEAAIRDGSAPKNLQMYLSMNDLKQQVANGQAPERLLSYIEPLDAWVGRKIGYGKPRYKRFAKELKRIEQPVSTWVLPSSMKKTDLEALDLSEVTTFEVGFTSEGTKLLSQILSNKDFAYPKPMSLIKALVGQATDSESGHIVMDFFAGSGTTGHAVLALNDEDNGNRSFVLVSSTEANKDEPAKNVCRDITAKRLRAAVEGYSYRAKTKTNKVGGLGGEFAYMRANRIPRETLAIDIRHDQIWFVLQQMHANSISPFKNETPIQILEGDEIGHDILYVPQLNQEAIDALRTRFDTTLKPCIVYSWQPGVVRQRFNESQMKVEKIPDYLIERFGRVDL
ncbi:site-specific DNA-methyltransferase [Sulfurimicrobium lacus]|uniref:site-specific DNA-methyltransferase (adenine-specific) n=1 Tax=Sulfurimicrobium lacus TaxID=2715678 RepID=A0A6F8V638_9PROT|nr:site-specific DNA-methyltransferase [Sulfurimicrobium lacus]BCB25293.1 site-specific DNA-methyltransferase [Sulfurimicrobium lacus]